MPNILCPTCGSTLEVAEDTIGQQVQCGSCQQVFTAELKKKAAKSSAEPKKSKYRRDEDERDYDEDDERPSKRRSSSRRREEEDDEDEDYDRPKKKKVPGIALAGMIVGIVSLLVFIGGCVLNIFMGSACACCAFIPSWSPGSIVGIVGLILSLVAIKKPNAKSFALTGAITSGITVILTLVALLLYVLAFFGLATFMSTAPRTTTTPTGYSPPPSITRPPTTPRR